MNAFRRKFSFQIRIYCIPNYFNKPREGKVVVKRKIYVHHATVRRERSAKGSRVNVNRWRVLLKAETPSSKNGQGTFFTSYWSQRTAFSARQREAPACTRLHGFGIFNTHVRTATRWKNDEKYRESSQSCAHNYFNCMFAIIITAVKIE